MRIDIVTIFPEFFNQFLETSIVKRAIKENKVEVNIVDIRKYSHNKHHSVDDTPYGGGAGMLMQFPPLYDCIMDLKTESSKTILLSPQGNVYHQETAKQLSLGNHLILICGHYEGFDARIEQFVDLELSIGDYVLTGGEIPAMIIADSIIRLVDDVIMEESVKTDSLYSGLLKYPQYTKPEDYLGFKVPEILLSGHHENIAKYRQVEAIKQTLNKRPDLFNNVKLSDTEKAILEKLKETQSSANK